MTGRSTRAGDPARTVIGGTPAVTMLPAPTAETRPAVTPGRITAPAPTSTSSSIRTGAEDGPPSRGVVGVSGRLP
ncbi:hypothetical protein ACIF9R_23595 [Streptomyces sp. NPDC086080]|uniref:hypothetical protein n=1 Tax=Streptomyces sp. NPDC086080 TaxID=3365748 RepID=UPI0037CD38BF